MARDFRRARLGAGALALVALLLAPGRSFAEELSGELEWHGPGGAHRRSSDFPDPNADAPYDDETHLAEEGLHLSPGLTARVYPRGEHGIFMEALYRLDLDLDGAFDGDQSWRVDFFVARGGYAHRAVSAGRRFPKRVAHALTTSMGLATGFARSFRRSAGMPERSPVLGPTVGAEYDVHVGRFFFGWALSVDFLLHTRGPMRTSRFFEWNCLPFARVGVTFGPRLQRARRPDEEAHDGR